MGATLRGLAFLSAERGTLIHQVLKTQLSTCMGSNTPPVLVYVTLAMASYFALRVAVQPKRIIYADDEHTIAEIAVLVARDLALHGYLEESAIVIAPIWNSAFHGRRDFSLDFVNNTISRFGLDLIWRGAGFIPLGFASWGSRFDGLVHTEEVVEIEHRMLFCSPASGVNYYSHHGASLVHSSWSDIRNMLAVWEDPDTRILYCPLKETELDALSRLEAYIEEGLPGSPDLQEYHACILGLELSLKYGEPRLVHGFLRTLAAQIATVGLGAIPIVRDLALSPRIGRIVRDNYMLRYATGFSRCGAREIAFETARALDLRFRWGEARPYADWSWVTLLMEIEDLESRLWNEEQESDLPFFRPGATPEQILCIEQELGVTLPQDYKEFLAVSNGLGSFNRSEVAPLLAVEDIFWDATLDGLKVEYRQFESNSIIARLPFMHRVLQVSEISYAEDMRWWLIEPALVQEAKRCVGENSPTDWLGVSFTEWKPNFANRGSFRIMMERRLSYLTRGF